MKKAEYNKKWCKDNKEYYRLRGIENRKKPEYVKKQMIYKWKQRGVISEDFESLYDLYINTDDCVNCGIQLNQDTSTKKQLHHNHTTGLFEGVVCRVCNVLEGQARRGLNGQFKPSK